MKPLKKFFVSVFGALGIGATVLGNVVAQSGAPIPIAFSEEDLELANRECQRALELGTIEALEEYLERFKRYPTACLTLALNRLNDFTPGESPDGRRPVEIPAGYGG